MHHRMFSQAKLEFYLSLSLYILSRFLMDELSMTSQNLYQYQFSILLILAFYDIPGTRYQYVQKNCFVTKIEFLLVH